MLLSCTSCKLSDVCATCSGVFLFPAPADSLFSWVFTHFSAALFCDSLPAVAYALSAYVAGVEAEVDSFESKDIAGVDSDDVAVVEAEYVADVDTEYVADVDTEYVADVDTEYVADVDTEYVADGDSDDVADGEANNVSRVDTEDSVSGDDDGDGGGKNDDTTCSWSKGASFSLCRCSNNSTLISRISTNIFCSDSLYSRK